jgi:hypothetical protein
MSILLMRQLDLGREIIGFRKKNLFYKLVPCVEVNLVSKFHPI